MSKSRGTLLRHALGRLDETSPDAEEGTVAQALGKHRLSSLPTLTDAGQY